jgi:diguanylate cyclase (GGDEF)-like protein
LPATPGLTILAGKTPIDKVPGKDEAPRVAIQERFSLRTSLFILVLACVGPLAALSAVLLVRQDLQQREQVEASTELLARKVVADLDREMAGIEAALKVLSTSQSLQTGNLRAFHEEASRALRSGIVRNYVLTDAQGRQRVNTLVPFGQALPTGGTPEQLMDVFHQRTPVLTDLFIGPVTRKPTTAMGVPVVVDGEVRYSLNMGLPADTLNKMLERQPLPAEWLVAVLDRHGVIVARSRDAARFVGTPAVAELVATVKAQREERLHILTREGVPVSTSVARSERWGWSVAVGAPEHLLRDQRTAMTATVAAGTLAAIGLGLTVAWRLARRVLATVQGLNAAARALHRGEPLQLPRVQLREAEAVAQAMQRAAVAMEQVKYLAQHDSLTGLANRMLFVELARHRLALARRQNQTLALLAIDLDGFKAVNDTDGHAAGDGVLKQAAARLEAACREADVAARLGGDEFMVLLGSTDAGNAERTGQRLIDALAQPYAGTDQAVSASVGLALFPEHGEHLEALMARADEALYAAKAAGKHRLRRAPPAP